MVEERAEWMYSVYLKDKFIVGLGDGVYLVGKEGSRMAPKYLLTCCWLGVAIHLGQKHKKIGPDVLGGRKIINPIRGMFYLLLSLRQLNRDVSQVGIWIFISQIIFECIYNPR